MVSLIEKMKSFARTKKGQAMDPISIVSTIAVVAMLSVLAVLVTGKFRAGIDTTGIPTAYNTSLNNVDTNVTSAFDLGALIPFVLAGAGLIGILLVAFGRRG
jgi:hypothetical protein